MELINWDRGTTFADGANRSALQGNQVYGPYGQQRYSQGSIGTPKGFTGQDNDSLTGLDYYGARYYDPVVGVFLSVDTVQGNGSGENPYAYVEGNPETLSDPTGQLIAASCYSQGCNVTVPPHPQTPFPGLWVGPGVTGGESSNSTASASNPTTATATCPTVGCRVTASLDTGSSLVALPSQGQVLCSSGFGIVCTFTGGGTTFYRLSNPPHPISFCVISPGCMSDEYGNALDEENATTNDNVVFANAELGSDGANLQPQDESSDGAQAGQPGEAETPTSTEPYVPGDYLRESTVNKAPMLSPGNRVLRGVHINDLGVGEPWLAIYDEYGRLIGRTDVTWGNKVAGIEPIHHHVYTYIDNLGVAVDGVYGVISDDHLPGVFDPFN